MPLIPYSHGVAALSSLGRQHQQRIHSLHNDLLVISLHLIRVIRILALLKVNSTLKIKTKQFYHTEDDAILRSVLYKLQHLAATLQIHSHKIIKK